MLFSLQDIVINKFLLESKDFSEVDVNDIDILKERDIKRLRAMESYCKTTGCLRNFILGYFGEKTDGICDNCGNCHREYIEQDMTNQAKWIINCIYETKGRYGLGVVLGTVMGANRAKLREVGANTYKSYGALSGENEATIRMLIDRMLEEGYICQSQDKFSVLKLGPNMNKLKDENTRVIVRMYKLKEKEKEVVKKNKKVSKAKGIDALSSEESKLFEVLRILRMEIAKEESVPPYIVFSDKTLIDMCVKLPRTKAEMLDVHGVGENKYNKYGQRFIDEIISFNK